MADTLQVVVFRQSNDERTCAVLRCQRSAIVASGNSLRTALVQALTHWMQHCPEGQEALESSAGDFNVGDLTNELPEPTLEPFLQAEGIKGLEIETYSGGETDWDYDDLLFDEVGLEVAPNQGGPRP